jgi:cyclic pyranopterin phosphate synthase
MLRAIPQIEDIALSTNGARLPEIASLLREAGLDRVNMSVDSLRPDRIVSIARRDLGFDPVRSALAAEAAGLDPIKLNMVVMRGLNDDEVEAMARLTVDHPWHVRFIELMPVGDLRELEWKHVVPSDEILARLRAIAPLAATSGPAKGNGPAAYYRWEVVQSCSPHREWTIAHLPVRRSRSGSAHAAPCRRTTRAALPRSAGEQAEGA